MQKNLYSNCTRVGRKLTQTVQYSAFSLLMEMYDTMLKIGFQRFCLHNRRGLRYLDFFLMHHSDWLKDNVSNIYIFHCIKFSVMLVSRGSDCWLMLSLTALYLCMLLI